MSLSTLSEHASRLGQRLSESFSEHTRDLAVARTSGAFYLEASEDALRNIASQLDSNNDREKLDALKRLIALISKGRNVSEYFAQVVKNVASQNLEIRKLVYIYLLRYAEQEPDLALLSINTFQKDLTDANPLIRAMALRVLSGIKVPLIGNILVLAIKKCSADISPYVRKAAALAIPRCFALDPSLGSQLVDIIATLLRDRSPLSIGSVTVAFQTVCPTRLDLLHQQYRRLCRMIMDVDEWGQVDLLGLLVRYARTMLRRPKTQVEGETQTEEFDPDLTLLLTSSEPVLHSANPAVVLAAVRVFHHIGPTHMMSRTVAPLLRLLHVSREVERVTLSCLLVLSRSLPDLFAPLYARFLVRSDDPPAVKVDKVQLLLNVITVDNHQAILREFIEYTDDVDDGLVSASIRAIGRCAHLFPDRAPQCLTALLTMVDSRYDIVVSNAILVLKSLIQNRLHISTASDRPAAHSTVAMISQLGSRVEAIRHPQAKACVLWLVGQYSAHPGLDTFDKGSFLGAPDVLRKCAKSFGTETTGVKLQVITLAAKLLTLAPKNETLLLLGRYVFCLARYDLDYDVRDRARTLAALLSSFVPSLDDRAPAEQTGVVLRREQVQLVLFNGKTDVAESTIPEHDEIGSLATLSKKGLRPSIKLPDWLEKGTDSSLRYSEDDIRHSQPRVPQNVPQNVSQDVSEPVTRSAKDSLSLPTSGAPIDLEQFYKDSDDDDSEDSDDDDSEEKEEEEEEEEEEKTFSDESDTVHGNPHAQGHTEIVEDKILETTHVSQEAHA